MHGRLRKRSAAITLVLAGSATLAGCGSPVEQRDAYSSLNDCVKDWTNSSLCEPVKDGRYSSSYLYGPPYFAAAGWSLFGRNRMIPSANAMEAVRLPIGSVASSSLSARASRLGISSSTASTSRSSSSSSTSRGGFGSSSSSSSSSAS